MSNLCASEITNRKWFDDHCSVFFLVVWCVIRLSGCAQNDYRAEISPDLEWLYCNQYHHVYFRFASGMCVLFSVWNATMLYVSESVAIFIELSCFEKAFPRHQEATILLARFGMISFRLWIGVFQWLAWHCALVGLCLFGSNCTFFDNNLCDRQ